MKFVAQKWPKIELIGRVRIGWRFLASKVASDTKFLGSQWTDLATFLVKLKAYQISANLVHRELRNRVPNTTFKGKNVNLSYKSGLC